MWTKEDIKRWESSLIFIEKKNLYKKEKEELQAYISKYAGKRMELEKQYQPLIKMQQYGIGKTIMQRGPLCPSKIEDIVVGNVQRGRLVKNLNKKQPAYIYSFDEKGRLIKAETTKELFDKTFLVEYMIYEGDCEIGITYRVRWDMSEEELVYVTRVVRENEKLISYEWGHGILEERNRIYEFDSEKYYYDENNVVKVDKVNLLEGYLTHNRYYIKINEKGEGVSYIYERKIGKKVIKDDYVRPIKKKVVFLPQKHTNDTKKVNTSKTKSRADKKEVKNTDIIDCFFTRIKNIMETWNEQEEIYAISFLIQEGEEGEVPSFAISYNTEEYCNGAKENDEERWNYACWSQDEKNVISEQEEVLLKAWYETKGISLEGLEMERLEEESNENKIEMEKSPKGMYEVVQILVDVVKKLKEEKIVECCCKKDVPVIIHDLEYSGYMVEATQKANMNMDLSGFFEVVGYKAK